ncbi:MAG: PTS lactose/cellobiose transporter subunit IIA [Bacilli bacterium]
MEKIEEVIFQLIIHAGNARSSAMEAIYFSKQGDYVGARKALHEAGEELSKAHKVQTSLIHQEAAGNKTTISLLLVHAQDHLMNGITVKEMATEFVELYERLSK